MTCQNFRRDIQVKVKCSAFIYAPNKVIVGVSFVTGQTVDEKVAYTTVATNEWRRYDDIDRFVKTACSKGGPFASVYSKLEKGEAVS